MEYKPTKAQEAIRDWLFKHGYASHYSPKKWNIKTERHHGKYRGYTVVIRTMRDAIEHVINDSNQSVA